MGSSRRKGRTVQNDRDPIYLQAFSDYPDQVFMQDGNTVMVWERRESP